MRNAREKLNCNCKKGGCTMSRLLLTELLSKTDLDNLPLRSLAGSAKNRQVSASAVPFVGGRGHKGGISQAAFFDHCGLQRVMLFARPGDVSSCAPASRPFAICDQASVNSH